MYPTKSWSSHQEEVVPVLHQMNLRRASWLRLCSLPCGVCPLLLRNRLVSFSVVTVPSNSLSSRYLDERQDLWGTGDLAVVDLCVIKKRRVASLCVWWRDYNFNNVSSVVVSEDDWFWTSRWHSLNVCLGKDHGDDSFFVKCLFSVESKKTRTKGRKVSR